MKSARTASAAAPPIAVLMLAVFAVSVGFGIVLPLLPNLIERLLRAGAEAAEISRHTGFLTGVYTLALFLFAPAWGWASDRLGCRSVLLVGLLGFGIALLLFSFAKSLSAVYAARFLSGVFAAAVTPIAAAAIGDVATTEQARGRRLVFVSMAGMVGFLVGPMLSVLLDRITTGVFAITQPAGSMKLPLVATALLAAAIALAVVVAVPGGQRGDRPSTASNALVDKTAWIVPKLLALTFIVYAGVGVFEVGLALRGTQELSLTSYQIALMFTECSVVMIAMQAIVFSPWIKPSTTRWLIPPTLAVLSIALFLVPYATSFKLMLAAIGGVAASAGILAPILTYWISNQARSAQGWELGKQTAAASLGATAGAAAGPLGFNIAILPGASFILVAGLTVLGFVVSLGMPRLLVARDLKDGTTRYANSRAPRPA